MNTIVSDPQILNRATEFQDNNRIAWTVNSMLLLLLHKRYFIIKEYLIVRNYAIYIQGLLDFFISTHNDGQTYASVNFRLSC